MSIESDIRKKLAPIEPIQTRKTSLWPQLYWKRLIGIPAIYIGFIGLLAGHIAYEGFSMGLLVAGLVLSAAGLFAIGPGYHRCLTHKSFEAHPLLKYFFLIIGTFGQIHSAIRWANLHRMHHKYTDDVNKDPYPGSRGLWYSHMGWLFSYQSKKASEFLVKDLVQDRDLLWQHKNYHHIVVLHKYVIPLGIGLIIGMPLGALAFLGFMKVVLCQQFIFAVNSLAHKYGKQNYSMLNTSKDNWWLAILTWGEGYHNYHHRYPKDYRAGPKKWDLDSGKWMIFLLSKLGLARNLRRVKAEHGSSILGLEARQSLTRKPNKNQ